MMDGFEHIFVLSMISLPAVFTVFVRRKRSAEPAALEEATAQLAAKRRRLWFWTAAAALCYASLAVNAVEFAASFMWMAFFPLWFLLALPVLQAKDPGWRGVPRASVRTASLSRRDVLPAHLQRAWITLTVIWLALLLAAFAGLAADAPGADMAWLLVFPLTGGAELALFHWCAKRSLAEAEPWSADETPEIRAARASLRHLKLYGWLGIAAVVMLAFAAPALILIWLGRPALMAAIVAGVFGGILGGIGGGVFGTMADLRRARLNRLCADEPVSTHLST